MKFVSILTILFFLVCSFVIAGPGPIDPEPFAQIIDEPSNTVQYISSDPSEAWDGITNKSNLTVLSRYVVGEVEYPVGQVLLNFRDVNDSPQNASLAELTIDIDIDDRKVLYEVSGVGAALGNIDMFIEKNSEYNAIHICEGASLLATVGDSLCAANGGTPTTIFPRGDTKGYTVSTFSDTLTGKDYWKVEGLSGTGLHLFNILFGGAGGPKTVKEGGTLDLDDEPEKEYVSKEKIEYFIRFEEKNYRFVVNYLDSESKYASIYSEEGDYSFIVSKEDTEEFDFNGDGTVDVLLKILDLDYPHVYAELLVIEPKKEYGSFEKSEKTKKTREYTNVGMWSKFVKLAGGTWSQILTFFLLLVLVVGFFGVIGWKLLSKIFNAN